MRAARLRAAGLEHGCMLMPRELTVTREAAVVAEDAGFAWMGFGDSPVVFGDSVLHQAEAARATTTLRVGPMVSHVVVRHPVVVSTSLSTLQELSGGRAVGTLATGNSAARGLGLAPATLADLRAAVATIRAHWRGEGSAYGDSVVPATGVPRRGAPLLVAGDGPKAVRVAGEVGDGVVYSGSLAQDVLERRVAAARAGGAGGERFWVAPAVSLATSAEAVVDELGAVVVAIANRALRGDLAERGVPAELHEDVEAMWAGYAYGAHGTFERPENAAVISPRLAEWLVDRFVLWGDEPRWAATLARLRAAGVHGVMAIVNQPDQVGTIAGVGARLAGLAAAAAPVPA